MMTLPPGVHASSVPLVGLSICGIKSFLIEGLDAKFLGATQDDLQEVSPRFQLELARGAAGAELSPL
jgi:hypothetical protein